MLGKKTELENTNSTLRTQPLCCLVCRLRTRVATPTSLSHTPAQATPRAVHAQHDGMPVLLHPNQQQASGQGNEGTVQVGSPPTHTIPPHHMRVPLPPHCSASLSLNMPTALYLTPLQDPSPPLLCFVNPGGHALCPGARGGGEGEKL